MKKTDQQKMSEAITDYIKMTAIKDDSRSKLSEDKSYHYFEHSMTRYFYSSEKQVFKNKLEYVAGILLYNFNTKVYTRGECSSFRKKEEAMRHATKIYERAIKK